MKPTIESSGNKPEKKIRAGAISATIWQNTGQSKTGESVQYRTVQVERSYKDKKTNAWKNTSSFRVSDLPKLALVSQKAYEYLVLKEQGDSAAEDYSEIELEDIM